MSPCNELKPYDQDNDQIILSEVVTADVAKCIVELANAEKLKKSTRLAAREASKTAKAKLERLQQTIAPHATQEPTATLASQLPPIPRSAYLPYVRDAAQFYADRARYCPEYTAQLQAVWDCSTRALPAYADSENNRLRGQCPVQFILGAWVQWMQTKAYEITGWE